MTNTKSDLRLTRINIRLTCVTVIVALFTLGAVGYQTFLQHCQLKLAEEQNRIIREEYLKAPHLEVIFSESSRNSDSITYEILISNEKGNKFADGARLKIITPESIQITPNEIGSIELYNFNIRQKSGHNIHEWWINPRIYKGHKLHIGGFILQRTLTDKEFVLQAFISTPYMEDHVEYFLVNSNGIEKL